MWRLYLLIEEERKGTYICVCVCARVYRVGVSSGRIIGRKAESQRRLERGERYFSRLLQIFM